MKFCNDNGIPHSRFLAWSMEDRGKAIGYMLHEGERCGMCGTAQWEWNENKFAYEPYEYICRGCEIKAASRGDHQDGKYVILRKKT